MIKLDYGYIAAMHTIVVTETGGSLSIRDNDLLLSAIGNVYSGFGSKEYYPTLEEKAARLGYNLIKNHAFVDGNKRIGVLAMMVFLLVNGKSIMASNNDIVYIGLGVASGEIGYEKLLEWVREHCD
jgi:death-on-curing protein